MAKCKMDINLCAVTLHVAPEAYGTKDVELEYSCVKDGLSVRSCKYYMPLVAAGGLHCYNECKYFREGCTCNRAIAAAKKRAYKILAAERAK